MDLHETLRFLCQNTVDILSKEELKTRLLSAEKEKRPLRIKAGFDPTAPDIHLGHAVLLRKLRQFQDLGHQVVLIIGDYTAMIGDPSGRGQVRQALTREEALKNAKTYQAQAFKILDSGSDKLELVFNSGWFFDKDMFRTFLEKVGTCYTVARLLERDDFEKRMKANEPITIREFIYPLLQGYDSVKVRSDVEIGGTDQKFNLLVGRNLQRAYGMEPQVVMTMPLLVGLDGVQKMSKSLGNYVGVAESPKDVFGKIMSIPDGLMEMYFDLLTPWEGRKISKEIQEKKVHPKEAKKRLASFIVSWLFGERKGEEEAEEFDRVFSAKALPKALSELELDETTIWIVELLKRAGMSSTGGEARRLIEQGAVALDGKKVTDPKAHVGVKTGSVLKAGKVRFVRLKVRK
ncbi:MAG: tyrosine--tRNA ligase [Candidatus Omnitrophica bacterium]|nr:tyrosine--tRNA ligase [Candidatus Omnitrophota bacterium]